VSSSVEEVIMRRAMALATTVLALVAGGAVTAPAQQVAAGRAPLRLGGVRVLAEPATRQAITVNATGGYHAVVSLWTQRHGRWVRLARTEGGRIGYGGLVPGEDREQGTGTTPLGTYAITETFGNARAPRGTRLPFHRVRHGDYWVQDNRSPYYNERRHISRGGFRPRTSEHLPDYGGQYRWSLVIDFNRPDPVRRRGAGIFLHVNGPGATAGCVSTPRRFIQQTMRRLRPGAVPVIAIGR
jgi:L,D-peptidoglycan transpeptidase YkuD (ErfK/YbiS/YcfS/YnhG family)